jgi:hypothetical protein
VARWAREGRYGNTARWGNDWRHIRGGGLIGGQFRLAGDVVGVGARRVAEVHRGGVKLEEVTVGQSGCWRRLVLGGGVLTAEEGSRCQLERSTRRSGGLTRRWRCAQGRWVVNVISSRDSQLRCSEGRGVVMKEQRRGEWRGREGGLHLVVAATGDKDRVVQRMGYVWRLGGQVARAVQWELPLGGGRGHDRCSV